MKKPAQNLVEFVLVFPLLLVIIFGILEFGMFYRNVSVVQDIATEASVVASRRLVLDSMTSTTFTATGSSGFNLAVHDAVNSVVSRHSNLGIDTLTFTCTVPALATPPNAFYTCESAQTRTIDGVAVPLITVYADYRNAAEDGIAIQVIYQHKTILAGMSFPTPGGSVVIIPRDMSIRSSRVRQYLSY